MLLVLMNLSCCPIFTLYLRSNARTGLGNHGFRQSLGVLECIVCSTNTGHIVIGRSGPFLGKGNKREDGKNFKLYVSYTYCMISKMF